MRRRTMAVVLATVALLGALAVACSGNDSEAPDSTMSTTSGGVSAEGRAVLPGRDAANDSVSSTTAAAPPLASSDAKAYSSGESGSGGTTTQPAVDLLGRKVIRDGALDLEVESVADSYDRVNTLAASLGGYVSESSFLGTGDSRSARLVIRVPADRYDQALASLRGIAHEVRSMSSNSQDVTGEVTDLDAALRNLRAIEAQYVTLLSQAKAIPDILQVQERLTAVRGDIERTEGRLALLGRLTDLATITIQLAPVPVVPARIEPTSKGPTQAAADAWDASLESIRQVAVVGVSVIVYSWWLVPVAAVGAVVAMRVVRSRRANLEAPAPAVPAA